MKRLQQQLQGTNSTAAKGNKDDDDAKHIFQRDTVGIVGQASVFGHNDGELHHVDYDDAVFWKKDSSSSTNTTPLLLFKNILWSSFFFFGYQWTQLKKVMSVLSPLAFSILMPFE